MATGRVDLGGGSKKSAPAKSSGGAMGSNDKAKLGIAVGALVVAGLVMGWFLGAFDSLFEAKIPEGTPQVNGSPVTAEEKAEFDRVKKEYDQMLEEGQKKGDTSAGS